MSQECNICFDNIVDFYTTDCKHTFCQYCIARWTSQNTKSCPVCRTSIKQVRYPVRGPKPLKQVIWSSEQIAKYQHLMTTDLKDVLNLLDKTFGVDFDISNQNNATIASLSKHRIVLYITGQKDWVPQTWVEAFAKRGHSEKTSLLNSGIYGCITFHGIEPPNEIHFDIHASRCLKDYWFSIPF